VEQASLAPAEQLIDDIEKYISFHKFNEYQSLIIKNNAER